MNDVVTDPIIDDTAFDPKTYQPGNINITPDPADANALVKFEIVSRPAGYDENSVPLYKEVEYIDIRWPGKNDPVRRPATFRDKQRFPNHYRAFKQRVAAPTSGYPLKEWAGMPRSMVDQLAFFNIKTVEHMASVSDADLQKIRGGSKYKIAAQKFLDELKNNGSNIHFAEQMKEKDAKIAMLEQQLDATNKRIDALLNEKRKPTNDDVDDVDDAPPQFTNPVNALAADIDDAMDDDEPAKNKQPEPKKTRRRKKTTAKK